MNSAKNTSHRRLTATLALLSVLLISALPALAAQGVVNVNQADAEALTKLPRIGPAIAQRIVDFREENGRFESKADLMLVRGIGERTYELLEPYVTLDGESTLDEKVRVPRDSAEEQGDDAGSEG